MFAVTPQIHALFTIPAASAKHCLVPRPLSVFHLGQSVSGHVVRAKKRGPDIHQKLRQMSQIFLARNFTFSCSRHGGKIGKSGKFELIFDAKGVFYLPRASGNSGWVVNGTCFFGSFH